MRQRHVNVRCHGCGALVAVEFDPPEDPSLRGRIEVIVPPTAGRPTPPARPGWAGQRAARAVSDRD